MWFDDVKAYLRERVRFLTNPEAALGDAAVDIARLKATEHALKAQRHRVLEYVQSGAYADDYVSEAALTSLLDRLISLISVSRDVKRHGAEAVAAEILQKLANVTRDPILANRLYELAADKLI